MGMGNWASFIKILWLSLEPKLKSKTTLGTIRGIHAHDSENIFASHDFVRRSNLRCKKEGTMCEDRRLLVLYGSQTGTAQEVRIEAPGELLTTRAACPLVEMVFDLFCSYLP